MKSWKILFIFFVSSSAFAFQYPYTLRSPKGLLMGDAYTAVSDDEYTLFYNPAALARHKYDLSLYPFSGHLSGTNVLDDLDRFKDFPKEPVGVAGVLMDYPAHASAGVAPGFKLFNFGLTLIANESFDVLVRNKNHPMMEIDIRSDKGVAMGVAVPLGPWRLSKTSHSGSQTSLGVGAKYIERTGVKDTLALTGPAAMRSLGGSGMREVLNSLGRVKGIGWGFDAGLEHVVRHRGVEFVMGLSALDISTTDYKVDKNDERLEVAKTNDQVNLGLSMGQDFKLIHYVLSADIRALNEQMDFGRRTRFGAQIGIPGITLLGGLNSGYYSYGAQIDLVFMKLSGGLYDIELGSKYRQTKSKRFILYLSLFDFSFDA